MVPFPFVTLLRGRGNHRCFLPSFLLLRLARQLFHKKSVYHVAGCCRTGLSCGPEACVHRDSGASATVLREWEDASRRIPEGLLRKSEASPRKQVKRPGRSPARTLGSEGLSLYVQAVYIFEDRSDPVHSILKNISSGAMASHLSCLEESHNGF